MNITHKTPAEFEAEIIAYVKKMTPVKPEDLNVGDLFVVQSKSYQIKFGLSNTALFAVTSKTKTMIKAVMAEDAPNGEVVPGTMTETFTFKGCARDYVRLCRASFDDKAHVEQLLDKKADAEWARQRREKNKHDVYVLWNSIYDNVGAAETRAYSSAQIREGFVTEVFNGCGEMIARVRMLTDADASMEHADNEAIQRMVTGYAICHFNRDSVKNGSKFQIHYVPEMD